jgi:hypothetical protein
MEKLRCLDQRQVAAIKMQEELAESMMKQEEPFADFARRAIAALRLHRTIRSAARALQNESSNDALALSGIFENALGKALSHYVDIELITREEVSSLLRDARSESSRDTQNLTVEDCRQGGRRRYEIHGPLSVSEEARRAARKSRGYCEWEDEENKALLYILFQKDSVIRPDGRNYDYEKLEELLYEAVPEMNPVTRRQLMLKVGNTRARCRAIFSKSPRKN